MDEEKKLSLVPADALGSNLEFPNQRRFRSKRFRRDYANNLGIAVSRWDISVTFGQILDGQHAPHVIEEILQINLSPQFAKAVALTLLANIKAYEETYGELQVPSPVEVGIPDEPAEPAQPREATE